MGGNGVDFSENQWLELFELFINSLDPTVFPKDEEVLNVLIEKMLGDWGYATYTVFHEFRFDSSDYVRQQISPHLMRVEERLNLR